MENHTPDLSKDLKKVISTYINAAYLGLISAFAILFFEFYTEGMNEHLIIGAWILCFYSIAGYLLGKALKKRGMLIGLILSLPAAAVTYWIPEALAQSAFDDKKFVVLLPLAAFIVATIAQQVGKRKV